MVGLGVSPGLAMARTPWPRRTALRESISRNINPIYIDSENFDILNEHLDYIHSHPVRERIVSKPEDYIYSSARDYAGLKGLVNITMLEEQKESNFILRRVSSY